MNKPNPDSIIAVRKAIDDVDYQIVTLLCQRQHLVSRAASFKTDENSVRAPERVKEVISRVRELAKQKDGSPEILEQIYRAIISAYTNYELKEKCFSTEEASS